MTQNRYPRKIIPPDYERIFERERLFTLVERKKTAELIWVNGAPGAGKTVFVASLLKKRGEAFLWYRIDTSGNNFADIFYFLSMAAQRNYPEKKFKLPVFTAEYADDIENFAPIFFRELYAVLIQETAIVLDNCQELESDPKFFRLLQIAIDQLPHDLQMICISRNRPGNELGRLSVANRLLEIGDNELQFTTQESDAFIRWLDPTLHDDQIRYIQTEAHGWAAGIVLMVRQMINADRPENIRAHGSILDYLFAETLPRLPRALQEFLTACTVFSQFTANMGVALTGYHQAASDLDALVFRNFLIERTSGAHPIYRFHPLFRDLLLIQAHKLFAEPEWRTMQQKAAQILTQQDRALEALAIYHQLQDRASLKALLMQETQRLIDTGRHRTLLQWIKTLPDDELEVDAWLNYWYAIALRPSDPLIAEARLEISYQHFVDAKDVKGIYSVWIAAIESIAISWDNFSKLEAWMNRFDEIRKRHVCPSIELKIRFYATALQAFSIYSIQHPLSRSLIRICEGIFRFIPMKSVKIALSLQLAQYYLFNLQLAKAHSFIPYLEQALENEVTPSMVRIMSAYLLIVKNLLIADTAKGLEYTHKGLELSEKSGLHLFKGMLLANSVGCHINSGDLISADNALQRAIKSQNDRQRIPIVMHYAYGVWLAALKGNLQYALEQNQRALQLAQLVHFEIAYACLWSLEAQLLADLLQWQKAEQALTLLAKAAQDNNNNHNKIQYYIAVSWLAFLQQDEPRLLSATKELLRIMRTENFFAFFGWRPNVFTALCLFAIENGVEQEFAIQLLKKHRLLAAPPVHLEQWPWPVRIYSFGTLTIVVDGVPVKHAGKSQKKILELLEMLINFGGRDVHCDHLAGILWPDAEGDLARQSFETTLHRLRKLLGKDAVLLSNGLLSLNDQHCWLDLWALEATAAELEQVLASNGQQSVAGKLTNRLLTLYRGVFLKNQDSGTVILKQEQLLNHICRLLDLATDYYQTIGMHEQACRLLVKTLELKPLVETSYRRLMSHYITLGQPDQALHIYRQCQRVLCQGFNLPLSDDIQLLIKQIECGS